MLIGNERGLNSEINVTPMIDVLLVLLIIFMVIVPSASRGEAARVPQPSTRAGSSDAVVLEVLKDREDGVSFRVNRQPVARGELASRLAAIYQNRARRVLFVKGDDRLSFNEIAQAIDVSRTAGVEQVGLMTPGVSAQ